MNRRFFAPLLGSILAVALAGGAQATLIVNGGFEGAQDVGGYVTLSAGDPSSTAITGWEVTSGSIDWIGSYWQPSEGSKSIDLAGLYQNGVIVGQSFDTVAGQTYLVQFDMAGNPDKGYDKTLVSANVGGANHTFTIHQTGTFQDMDWQTMSFTFVATGATTQLSFGNVSNDPREAWGAALDNIRVDAVPEPATLLLLGSGLVGVAGRFRRKK